MVMDYTPVLEQLSKLPNNWDGCKSKAPTPQAVTTASCVVPHPLSDGGIQIEFHAGGLNLEISISPEGHVRGVNFRPRLEPKHG
jgi:hypothetical protein